jgi:hypothetical protein
MFCKKCGHERQGGEKFCPVCGTPFPEEDGNQVVPNMTSATQVSEGNAIDNKVVGNTPQREEPTPIVDNSNSGNYNTISKPTRSGNKPALITFCVLILVIIFGVTVSALSSSDSSESSTDNSESVNTTDNNESDANGTYGPDWLHQSSFRSFTSDGDKLYLKFGGDGSFSLWENSGDDETTMLSIDGNYTVSGDNLTITLNNGTVMNYTLNEGNQSVVSSSGAEFTSVQ